MSKRLYSFHSNAIEQQVDIWLYTYENWGEQQADKYIDGLHEHLSAVTKNPGLLRSIPNFLIEDIYFSHYQRHYLFLKTANENLVEKFQVLSILHDSMDIPSKLKETLDLLFHISLVEENVFL